MSLLDTRTSPSTDSPRVVADVERESLMGVFRSNPSSRIRSMVEGAA